MRPIRLIDPKYSPFGQGRLDRIWTVVCALVVDREAKTSFGNVAETKICKNLDFFLIFLYFLKLF